MSAGREVVMGQKIGIYLYHQENVRCYIPVVSDSENKIHIGNETWQKFCIKISLYFQSNSKNTTSDLREEMRHHTADTTDGMLSLGKEDMVSAIVLWCLVSNLIPCKKELKSLGSCLCKNTTMNRENLN